MDSREALDREIAHLQQQLKARLEARRALDRLDPRTAEGAGAFTGKRPLAAIRKVLADNNGPMREEELTQRLIDGGITSGRKRAAHNIRISIDISCKAGSLIRKDGMVYLPSQISR